MNEYLKNLSKIEFVITYACTGKCKHCSEGDHSTRGKSIDKTLATEAVRKITSIYDIKTVMTFGGEPLLHPDIVCAVMSAAAEMNVERRQVITNGFFSKDENTIKNVCRMLANSGVNDLLLSVDAFHQETIPIDIVKIFARNVRECDIPLRLQPAWLVDKDDDNVYNVQTREILKSFEDICTNIGDGNVIFPEGNALKNFSEYFKGKSFENPYVEDAKDVRCVSFDPDGKVLDGNIYEKDILEILKGYKP